MKQLIAALALVIVGFMAVPSYAQQTVVVDINKAELRWNWVKGTEVGVNDGDVAEFRMKCGPATQNYTRVTVIGDPAARSLPIKEAIDGSGSWFCAVTAANEFGESGPSNEVSFRAGTLPAPATGLEIVSQ